MEATLDEFEGVCKQLEVGGKFNTKAGYRFAELLELLFHYGIKPETNAWDYFAHLTNSVPSNDVPAAEALVNFAQTAASTSRGRVRAFLFCCMAKHTLPEIFFSLLWNRDLGAACYTNAAESIVLNDELETKLEETLGAASKALKLCPRSLIPTVPLDAKNFWHVVFSAFTQPSQLYAKLSEAIKALVEEVCTDSGSSSVVESNNEKAAIVVHILSEILSEETMGKTAWPLLKAFSNVPVVEAPHPETNVESWVMLCLNTSSLTSQIKATLFNHRNVLDKFYTRDSYFFNSASEEKLTIELTLLETLHFNFNVLSSDTTIQRHVTKKHKRKKKSIATIMGPEEENPQNNEDEHTTKSTGALKRDKGKRETLRKNHSVEGSIGLREEEEEETEHITTIKEGNETHHNKGHPAEDKIPKEKQSYTTEYQLLNEKCVNTNPFEDNSYEREVNANPFKDDSRETETNINPFKEEVPPGEKNLFEDDNRETERNTNPFKEEVSPEETNPFEDNNRETETNTNPFEEEVPPEETNPFEDDNRETETNTNPFEEEVPPEETNPFEDEPSSEKTKTNPFKDKKPEIPKVSQPENNDCERSIKSDEQKHKKEGTIKSERNSLNKSSTMESLSSHKKALNEGLLTPVTAIQINPFEFDKDESQNSLDRSAEENTKRQNLSNTGDDSQRKSLQGVDKPRVFTEDNLNEKQSKVITNKRTQKTTSEKAYETHHFEDNELNETRHLVTTENKVINSEKGDQETKGLETQVHFDRKESSTMSNITFGFPQTIQSKRTEADSLKFEKVSKADKVIDYDDFQECYFKRYTT